MKLRPIYLWISALLLFLALVGLAYLGTFTRFHADDFCMAGDALHLGLPGMLAKWYNRWTGRFTFIIVTGLFGLGGPRFAGWLPALAAAIWLTGLGWASIPLIKRSGWPHLRLLAFLAGGLALLILLSSIPNLFQSFFWQNGMVNYSLPLIGLTFSGGIILRVWLERTKLLPACVALFALAFLSGGFTEAFSAMQVTIFTLALLISFGLGDRSTRSSLLPVLGAALVGGLAALLIVFFAPGNQVRLQAVGNQANHPGLLRIIILSIQNMAHVFENYFLQTPLPALVSIVLPFLAGWLFSIPGKDPATIRTSPALWEQRWLRGMVLVLGAAVILVTAACAPVVYALNTFPDDRTIIVPQFVIVVAVMSASGMLGAGLRQRGWLPDPTKRAIVAHILQAAILAVILLTTGISIRRSVRQIPDFQSFARTWDERAAILQQAALSGQSEITVTGGSARFGVGSLSADPNNWKNLCMASYYQIPQIRGR
jgi:hypothetical protein